MKYSIAIAATRIASVPITLFAFAAASTLIARTASGQTACYVPGSGTVYRIKEPNTPARCGTGHVEFQLAAGVKPSSGPTGPAGGDLGGSYPNPTVAKLQGQPLFNAAGAFDLSNQNGIVSVGTTGAGELPVSGAGTRFMWYPAKRALRAGGVLGTHWDLANVGDGSVALGLDPTASGTAAIALGNDPTASGDGSVAIGSFALASGFNSTALGPIAQATANSAVAIGNDARAAGLAATAIGNDAAASADYGTAIGYSVLASGIRSTALGSSASTNGMSGTFVYGDASSPTAPVTAAAANQFAVRAQHYWFGTGNTTLATAGRLIETSTGAYLTTGGAWTNSSDVNRKHEFRVVDGDDLLDKIAAMPVQTWSYRAEDDSVRHMGPTAQDFRRAFGLGDTDKAIATIDADGVSLAAIKALLQRTTNLRRENDDLRAALADVYRRLAELEAARR